MASWRRASVMASLASTTMRSSGESRSRRQSQATATATWAAAWVRRPVSMAASTRPKKTLRACGASGEGAPGG